MFCRFEVRLVEIMKQLKSTYDRLEGRLQAEGFKSRVLRTLKAWEDSIYPKDYMNKLHNVFLGLETEVSFKYACCGVTLNVRHFQNTKNAVAEQSVDIDGDPLQDQIETDEDVPMDGAMLLKSAMKQNYRSPTPGDDTDIDGNNSQVFFIIVHLFFKLFVGEEIHDNDDKKDKKSSEKSLSGFILSKWETVDPEQVEAQAMTTSKWDLLESSTDNQDSSQNDQDSNDYSDTRYNMLFNVCM